mgnify:CR=1 FL=1
MRAVAKPPDEADRLSALRSCDVLDTSAEPVYDDVVGLLARFCDVPIATVGLVDADRLWLKARVGLDVDELPRDLAPCAHAILSREPFVVCDASADERFADNPLVVGAPHVRFYAGAPIVTSDGLAIGTVCIADTRPRTPTSAQLDALQTMARQVAGQLELRRTVAKLEALGQRHELVVGITCDGVWDLDLATRTVGLSARVCALLGRPELAGSQALHEVRAILHPDDRRGVERAAIRHLRRGTAFDREFRCRHADGGWRWFRARSAMPTERGRAPRRLVGSLVDIHTHRCSQEHLQRVSRLLAESQALARVGGWELDLSTNDLFWTTETFRIHDTSPRLYTPTVESAIDFYVPSARPRIRAALDDAIARGRAFSLELEVVTARGRRIWCRATGGAVFAGGRAVRVLGAFQDITAQRRLDAELMRAKEAAEAANEAKSAFLAAMSHEIRTPMHTVLGYADVLRQSRLSPEQHECLDIITSSGNSLLRLIDDILDFSKAEAGKMQLENVRFDLHAIAREVGRMMQPLAGQKGLGLEVEADGAGPFCVLADPQRTRQVLVNLVGNAIKFTAKGGVVTFVSADDEEVRVEIRDTGIGIAAEHLPRLFANFVQVDASTQRQFGGTGLGLAISRQLVEGMGGQIGVESRAGVGSTFWFTLPRATESDVGVVPPSRSAEPVRRAAATVDGRRVLLVEDNRLNQRLAVRVLETFGFVVETANDGAEAVALVRERSYDLVLMDCLMPGMDGFEATRRIRAHEAENGRRVPIIALTANALPEDRQACLAAGMDDFVSKPFTRQVLHETTLRWLQV